MKHVTSIALSMHVLCKESCYPDDVRSDSSDRHFTELSRPITTVKKTKVTQRQYEKLELYRLIVNTDLGLESSQSLVISQLNLQFQTVYCGCRIFLGWLELTSPIGLRDSIGRSRNVFNIIVYNSTNSLALLNTSTTEIPSKTLIMPTCEQNDPKNFLLEFPSMVPRTANR